MGIRFILVHGGWHGAWCWEQVIPELEALGHSAVAIDLPGNGRRQGEGASLEGFARVIADVAKPEDVLVGHSMGGYAISAAMDRTAQRYAHALYLAAPVPVQGESLAESYPMVNALPGVSATETHISLRDVDAAAALLFHDCNRETQQWAFDRLCPQEIAPLTAPIEFTSFWDNPTPRSYLACLEDRSGILERTEKCLAQLGISHSHVLCSSHSPFLSRPHDLARMLERIAVSSPVRTSAIGRIR